MRYLILCSIIFFAPLLNAYAPYGIDQKSLSDITRIDQPEMSRMYFGELKGFPHTFEIRSIRPFRLTTEILMPDIDSSKNNISGIIIREVEGSGRVTEVTRLKAVDATWETYYEPTGGDTYRKGGRFDGELESGVYRIEVSTPENFAKYVLMVGNGDPYAEMGYFEKLGKIKEVKTFFEKPAVYMLESPLIYIPTISVLTLFGLGYIWWRRRKQRMSMV